MIGCAGLFLSPVYSAALKIYPSTYAQKGPQFAPVAPCLVMFFTDRRNETKLTSARDYNGAGV